MIELYKYGKKGEYRSGMKMSKPKKNKKKMSYGGTKKKK